MRLDQAQWEQVVVAWNRTAVEFPAQVCLHELVRRQAAATPDVVAVRCGDRELAYAGLDARAGALAARLGALGVGPESRVGVLADRSVESAVALLGVLKAGGAYVPVDPSYPPARLRYVLADAAVVAVVGGPSVAEAGARLGPTFIGLSPDDAVPDVRPARQVASGVRPDNLAYVIYTSGSTGAPKGVAVSHRQIVASTAARWAYEDPGTDLLTLPLTFDAAAGGLYWMWTRGGTVVIPTEQETKDPRLMARLVRQQPITHINSMHAHYKLILDATEPKDLRSLRFVDVGGEPLPPTLITEHYRRTPDALLCNCYGPTESTVWATVFECRPAHGLSSSVPIGRPVANARVYVLDEFGEPVAVGVPGELFIGGEGVARGYVNQPGLTAARFVPDPFGGGARLYRTGDRARLLPDGNIDFLGRMDSQVKVRGFRVELGEIEAVIGRHPLVAEAVVTVREDSPGVQRLVAHVVPAAGRVVPAARSAGEFGAADLKEWLSRQLPPFMRPDEVAMHPAMPRTASGKLDRTRLTAVAPGGAPGSGTSPGVSVDPFVGLTEEQIDRLLSDLRPGTEARHE